MGTALGVVFIAAATAAGLFVGTRPTVIDGRRLAAELEASVRDQGITVECDRRIRLGVDGAAFACTYVRLDERQRVEYRMTRDGAYGPAEPGRGGAP